MPQETILSPGVLAIENDKSFTVTPPVQAGAAIIGPTVKGKVGIPTVVTSFSDYLNKFGSTFVSGSQTYTYFTSISTYNYFQNGGTSLLVTRVVSGSTTTDWTPATSSMIPDSGSLNEVFVLETISEGILMNNTGILNPDGSLASGSANNVRWQIVSPNTSSGTFSLVVRRGDDNTNTPSVMEVFSNLSLDPYSPNYIEKIVGNQVETIVDDNGEYYVQMSGSYSNQSSYVRVKQVNITTPNYLDNAGNPKPQYTASIPLPVSGTFGGAKGDNIPAGAGNYYENINDTNSQGIPASSYTTSISLLSNKDEYNFNFISTPGLVASSTFPTHATAVSALSSNCQYNGNSLYIVDVAGYGAQVSQTANSALAIDNSYVATYWPWLQTIDPNTLQQVWVPASTMIPGVIAFNDASAEVWSAPAGTNRGKITSAIRAERNITQGNRDILYQANVNPIATLPNTGITVFGQKTLQKKSSALDRVGVRRLLIEVKGYISQIASTIVFEQNNTATRNNFLLQVNPYLASIQQRGGLYGFNVVMDESNNTPTVIDNNQLVGAIYLQPTKTAEFILLNFNVLPTGVQFI
jgi:hypothetical protein